jgi:GTP-binding protein Era
MRAGFVAILGAPNAGKSTLLNAMLGTKLAIVTPKVQTTRSAIKGICMVGRAQLVFVDTPGIFGAEARFEKAMVAAAWSGAADADAVLLLVDASRPIGKNTRVIVDALKEQGRKAILVMNKVDIAKKEQLLQTTKELHETNLFSDVFMISAQDGDGVEDLKLFLANAMPQGHWFYPEDQLTDISERLLASEITREKLFMQLDQELPYSLTVETESFEQQKNGSIKINQIIYVQRESQKTIVLGKGGRRIKSVGEAARKELSALWDCKVHVFLFVKVREKWKENPEIYRYLGLEY